MKACGSCGNGVAERAVTCPHCGNPLRDPHLRSVLLGLLLLGLIAALVLLDPACQEALEYPPDRVGG